jgi:preprotein translocase subunit SecG
LGNLDLSKKNKLGGFVLLPIAFVFGVLGLGSPVYFSSVSEDSLKDVGKGSKTIDNEIVRQLRQNNLGPAEMLLPLTSLSKREEFASAILAKKKAHPELSISGGGSIFDMLTFKDYFGGIDQYNLERGRFEAFFVYNRATTRGDLLDRLSSNSSNDNVQALIQGIPHKGRPGDFWAKLLNNPLISTFPGVKIANLVDFPFFPDRRVVLSVGVRFPGEFDDNDSEAEIRDLCMIDARNFLKEISDDIAFFNATKKNSDTIIEKSDDNASFANIDFSTIGNDSGILKVGRMDNGGYAVIVGGIINKSGKFEKHGRWLPYPILVPMMVGTALSIEKEYFTSDAAFEIGKLSHNMLKGDFESKERIRSFYWAAHQLARKMNLMQMAELTQACIDLQAVFDLSALIRMRNRPLSEAIGKIKFAERKMGFLPFEQRSEARENMQVLIDEKKLAQKRFEDELRIIYGATLLSSDPSGLLRYIQGYPVFKKDGDKEAAIFALEDIARAMNYGEGALNHLIDRGTPINDKSLLSSLVDPIFPLLGGKILTFLSHSYRASALFLKISLLVICFLTILSFSSTILPKPSHHRSKSHFFLRWTVKLSSSILVALIVVLSLEPNLLQTPRGQISVAGFDFALANLLAYAKEESMAEQNLTVVTAIIAGAFFLVQVVIFMICMSRISQVKNEEGLKPSLKLSLLDNEENLFDLGLYVGLGGTVLSLILLLVLDVKQDALIGAYTSTLFGILFVAALKIFVVRPYRNHLLMRQDDEKRYES